jgi:hypothetical protein
MGDEEIVTLTWITGTGEVIERDVPANIAEAVNRGELAIPRDAPTRRFSAEDAIARYLARIDQLRSRQDELVNEYPQLKSVGPKRPE